MTPGQEAVGWGTAILALLVVFCLIVIAISTYRLTQISVDTLRMDCSWLNLVCE